MCYDNIYKIMFFHYVHTRRFEFIKVINAINSKLCIQAGH